MCQPIPQEGVSVSRIDFTPAKDDIPDIPRRARPVYRPYNQGYDQGYDQGFRYSGQGFVTRGPK